MSSREAGKRFEKKIQEYLESLGFVTDRARPALKYVGPGKFFSGPNDFLKCADLIAVRADKPYSLFIQCHRGSSIKPRKLKLEAVPWNLSVQKVQLWTDQEGIRGGIRVLELVRTDTKDWVEMFFRIKNGEPPPAEIL